MLNVANSLKDCGGNYFSIMAQKMTVIYFIICSCSSLPNPSADKNDNNESDKE